LERQLTGESASEYKVATSADKPRLLSREDEEEDPDHMFSAEHAMHVQEMRLATQAALAYPPF